MSVPANVRAFYEPDQWGTRFGVVDAAHPNGHRGLDQPTIAREAVPALRAGTVALVQFSSILGWVVVVRAGLFQYDGYAHKWGGQLPRVGQKLKQGAIVGLSAGYGDSHGSAWTGPHNHLTNGPIASSVFYGRVRNPETIIRRLLGSSTITAGTGTTTPTAPPKPAEDLTTMATPIRSKESGKYYLYSPDARPPYVKELGPKEAIAHAAATGQTVRDVDSAKIKVLQSLVAELAGAS